MDKISALIDGEVSEQEARAALQRLKQNDECCQAWSMFHLIGDVMRQEPVLGGDFAQRVCSQLEQEPTMLAPRFSRHRTIRYALTAAASLAAVAFVLTLVSTTGNTPVTNQAQIAAVPSPVISTQMAQRAGTVNEYLMAHQEFSPSTSMQGMAPYIRTVSETSGNR
jgi:sigma-E factor negative regulatory protein RseA